MKKLTVSYEPRPRGEVPQIRLRGKWLATAGFPIGARYTALFEAGNLILSPAPHGRSE